MRHLFVAAVVAMLSITGAGQASADKRVALVIGNGAYAHMPSLANPPGDARDMVQALGTLGFDVVSVIDGDHRAMLDALAAFGRAATGADAALLFYAGHGVQVGERNYLLPVSADVETEADLPAQAMKISDVLDVMEVSGAAVKLVFLDACRDNPLATSLSRGSGRGLARIEASTAGTLVAFATAPGSVADDGDGRNSPFTRALVHHISTPGLEIRQLMGRVRGDVYEITDRRQVPWVNEALIGDFYFAGSDGATSAPPPPPPPQPPVISSEPPPTAPTPPPALGEAEAFGIAQSIDSIEAWDAFLAQFPNGSFAAFATAARNKLAAGAAAETTVAVAPPQPAPTDATRSAAATGFIFPDSDRRRLTWDEVAGLSTAQLRIARNEIFARRGRYFQSADLQQHFGQYNWYRPFTWETPLSAVESANVALIQQVEAGR